MFQISPSPPNSLSCGAPLFLSLFPNQTPLTPDATVYECLATTGEVEDYQWFFGPTVITLVNATTGSQDSALALVLALTAAVLEKPCPAIKIPVLP